MKRSILQDESEPSDSKELFKKFTFIVFVDKYAGLGSGKEFLNLEVIRRIFRPNRFVCCWMMKLKGTVAMIKSGNTISMCIFMMYMILREWILG